MTKYYYKVQGKQFGPLELEQLKGKNITATTPVWYEPLPKWTTAGEVPELKEIINQAPVAAPVAAATAVVNEAAVKEYYYKEGSKQVGPFSFDQMKAKALAPKTPVWYNPLPKWVTAEEVAELIPFLIVPAPKTEVREVPKVVAPVAERVLETATVVSETIEQAKENAQVIETPVAVSSPVTEPKEEQKIQPVVTEKPVKSATTATISVATTSVASAATAPVPTVQPAARLTQKPPKKGQSWILSAVLSMLVLAGAGYFVYQDMEKNKKSTDPVEINNAPTSVNAPANTVDQSKTDVVNTSPSNTSVETSASNNASVDPASSNTKTNKPVTVPVTTKTDKKATTPNPVNSAEADKTKTAAAAAAAKEAEVRNHWQNYVSFGRFDYKAHALKGIDPFFIPVINNSDYMLDQVTVWVDYIKKGGGVHKSETITINNIPPHSTLLGKANGNSRGSSVKTTITAISCRKIHFCYPQNNGTADPFYCK